MNTDNTTELMGIPEGAMAMGMRYNLIIGTSYPDIFARGVTAPDAVRIAKTAGYVINFAQAHQEGNFLSELVLTRPGSCTVP